MSTITYRPAKNGMPFKRMNAVNNGPVHVRHNEDQPVDNFKAYRELKIPFARNHDASFNERYGSEHTVDISAVFPDFDADVNDESSYDFACTDEYVLVTAEAGTETFFRLGQRIEHNIKKYHIYPPKDYQKWAEICEHIIRHYNEGWNNGFYLGITYLEIWNEPDGLLNNHIDPKTWYGTTEQFHDFFAVAAKHLKSRFPSLKIGGPALGWEENWARDFLSDMQSRNVPLDFFSWHVYWYDVSYFSEKAVRIRDIMDSTGYSRAESICDEWNYLINWTDRFVETIKTIKSVKGAAGTFAVMAVGQHLPVDMLMYYDARPCGFNCLFDTDTCLPIKGYYTFLWYRYLADTGTEIPAVYCEPDIYTLCGKDTNGKITAVVDYFTNDALAKSKELFLDFGKTSRYAVYLLDETHDGEQIAETDSTFITIDPNTMVMFKELP